MLSKENDKESAPELVLPFLRYHLWRWYLDVHVLVSTSIIEGDDANNKESTPELEPPFPWFHLWRWYLELDVIICIVEMRTWKSRYHFQRWYLDSHVLISTSISGTDDANSTRNQLQSWYHLFHGSISRE